MANNRIARNSFGASAWSANNSGFAVDSDTNQLQLNVDGTVRVVATDNVRALTAAYTVVPADNGTTFILNASAEFATTLPSPFAGAKYSFIVGGAPSGASYTVSSTTDLIHGLAVSSADAAGSMDGTNGTLNATITFVDGQAKAGDRVDVVSDGTYWYAIGFAFDEDAITFTAA
jgi:hypothetical protein